MQCSRDSRLEIGLVLHQTFLNSITCQALILTLAIQVLNNQKCLLPGSPQRSVESQQKKCKVLVRVGGDMGCGGKEE